MRIRDVYLLNGQTLNDSDTVTVDLTKGLKILSLRIQYQDQNGATSNTVCRLNGMVSKIAVVDGSNVLYSGSMRELQADNCFRRKRMPFQILSEDDDIVVQEECFIDFWRTLGDVAWYLDTSLYANPQLQLTHALTVSGTAGFVTAKGKLTVIAKVIDSGAPARAGFVMLKELDSFASTASGDHTTDLPLDFPIAALIVQAPVDANSPDTYLSNVKLTADTDSYIPLNESMLDLMKQNAGEGGPFDQEIDALPDTSATLLGDFYYRTRASIISAGATAKALATVVTANQITMAFTTGETGVIGAKLEGYCPHGSVIYRFGDGIDPAQAFSPQGVGKFQLKLTGASTGATVKVVTLQQHP